MPAMGYINEDETALRKIKSIRNSNDPAQCHIVILNNKKPINRPLCQNKKCVTCLCIFALL